MFDFNKEIDDFWEAKVRMRETFKEKLYTHRKANRDRLISRLSDQFDCLTISESSFKPQGSMAMRTIIQTKFDDAEYDIDDGLILKKEELVDEDGTELSTIEVRNIILQTLKDDRFVKQPDFKTNCIRVYYSEKDEEKHHVDFAIYRRYEKDGNIVRELANESEWIDSDPTQINRWFEDEIASRNDFQEGKGTQLRILIQLLKRFTKSRRDWDLPSGLKLTMLAVECQKDFFERIDVAFRDLLINLKERLNDSKIINNLAHPDKLAITRSSSDENVVNLMDKVSIALEKLDALDAEDCDASKARSVWDWIFKSDGFFEEMGTQDQKEKCFASKAPSNAVEHRGGGRFG